MNHKIDLNALHGPRSYGADTYRTYDLQFATGPFLGPGVAEMERQAQLFLNDLAHRRGEAVPRWLTFSGCPGCGKTHLARRIRDIAREQLGFTERSAQMWTVSRVAEMLRGGDWGVLDHLAGVPLLILDDLGAEYRSELLTSKLYDLFNRRLGRWTVLTTNLTAQEIADRLDARLTSRLRRGFNELVYARDARDYCWMRPADRNPFANNTRR